MSLSPRGRSLLLVGLLLALVGGGVAAYFLWWRQGDPPLPKRGEPLYKEYVRVFYVGVSALDAGEARKEQAEEKFSQAIKLVPGEPAGWANRALVYLRDHKPKLAAPDLKRAKELAPES